MKLLAPKETTRAKQSDEVRRKLKLDKLVKANQATYEEVKAKTDPKVKQLLKEFDEFTFGIQVKKAALLKQVKDLEDRKAAALEPLDAKWLELEEREVELDQKEEVLIEKQGSLDKLTVSTNQKAELLEEKLDEVADREYKVFHKETELAQREAKIRVGERELAESKDKFKEQVAEKNLELLEHDKKNFDQERLLEVRSETLDQREKDLDIYKLKLDDRAATLEAGFAELRSHGGS